MPILVLAFLVAGCSSPKLAYRYADWGIEWWVEDFVTLTRPQSQQLSTNIESLKKWHCSTELPRYSAWLDSIRSDLKNGNPDRARIDSLQKQLTMFLPPLLHQITPYAIDTLASLSDEQVSELADNMEERHRELEREYLSGNAEALVEARAERTVERTEKWLGSLNGKQQRIIDEWSENSAGHTRIWVKGRENWQQALLLALKDRHKPGFDETITELINNSESVRGKAYAVMMRERKEAMTTLIQDLLQASRPSHLEHLARRASDLSDDAKALTCQPGSEVASRALTGFTP